jgi:hypothetical protein
MDIPPPYASHQFNVDGNLAPPAVSNTHLPPSPLPTLDPQAKCWSTLPKAKFVKEAAAIGRSLNLTTEMVCAMVKKHAFMYQEAPLVTQQRLSRLQDMFQVPAKRIISMARRNVNLLRWEPSVTQARLQALSSLLATTPAVAAAVVVREPYVLHLSDSCILEKLGVLAQLLHMPTEALAPMIVRFPSLLHLSSAHLRENFIQLQVLLALPLAPVAKIVFKQPCVLAARSEKVFANLKSLQQLLNVPASTVAQMAAAQPALLKLKVSTVHSKWCRLEGVASKSEAWTEDLEDMPCTQLAILLGCSHDRLSRLDHVHECGWCAKIQIATVLKMTEEQYAEWLARQLLPTARRAPSGQGVVSQ